MTHLTQGNLLQADAEALVNTVNTVGVMGKGIALQFKRAYPENFVAYKRACDAGEVRVGEMFVFETGQMHSPKYIINFPTKRHWKGASRLEDVDSGLSDLIKLVRERNIRSIAIPPLGCGNGGLDWETVRTRILSAFEDLPEVDVRIFEPKGAPPAKAMVTRTTRPRMTPGRAAILGLMGRYGVAGYRLTLLEIQKLVYFLQEAGEPLKGVVFARGKYGPYADTLRQVLERMEGHYIEGYGDGANTPEVSITLLPGSAERAEAYLQDEASTKARFDRVTSLIDGFETPYGMELLSSVHWVAHREDMLARCDSKAAVAGVARWSPRKQARFQPEHIRVAWARLRDEEWL